MVIMGASNLFFDIRPYYEVKCAEGFRISLKRGTWGCRLRLHIKRNNLKIMHFTTKALGGRFADDAILVTDENNAYNDLAESEGIQLEQVFSTKHVKGPFNLARINSICDNLKNFLGPDRYRPSTKYLDLWLLFYIWLEKHKELNTYEKRDLLFELISDNHHNMSMNYREHVQRELTLNTKGLYPTKV